MDPAPESIRDSYRGSGKLEGKVALVTGGDSGIGRAVVLHFAREGADVAFVYLDEEQDAEDTREAVEEEGRRCISIRADVSDPDACREAVARTIAELGHLDVLVNNAAQQYPQSSIEDVSCEQLEQTFRVNLFGYVFMVQAALEHLPKGGAIINTGSVTAVRGSRALADYAATKGAIESLTYSLAQQLADRGIRVNGVAPGPIWTPLIPASFGEDADEFGGDTLMKRPGQPSEVAPAYVYLASEDGSYVTGEFIHINGGGRMG